MTGLSELLKTDTTSRAEKSKGYRCVDLVWLNERRVGGTLERLRAGIMNEIGASGF